MLKFSDMLALQFNGEILALKDGRFVKFDLADWVKNNLTALKDAKESGAGLTVDILASASGILINNRVYKGKDWKRAAKDFKDKPILKHHDSYSDAIGRIVSGKFEQKLTGPAFNDDFVKPAMQGHGSESGLVWVKANITDPESIMQIQDRRLLHTSQGSRAKSAVCSICGNDWADGYCEHRPGQMYRLKDSEKGPKKLCYWIVDGLDPKELSFVNDPAFVRSQVIEPSDSMANDERYIDLLDSIQGAAAPIIGSEIHKLVLVDALGKELDLRIQSAENIEIFTLAGNPENGVTDSQETNKGQPTTGSLSNGEAMELKELQDKIAKLEAEKAELLASNTSLRDENSNLKVLAEDSKKTLDTLQAEHDKVLEDRQKELAERYVDVAKVAEDAKEATVKRLMDMTPESIKFMIDEAARLDKKPAASGVTGPETEGNSGGTAQDPSKEEPKKTPVPVTKPSKLGKSSLLK